MSTRHPYARPRPGANPDYLTPSYGSTLKRAPRHSLVPLEQTLTEVTGPLDFGWAGPENADLTRQHKHDPLGERIIVTGRVLDENGRPVPNSLVELWQCNASGRYIHGRDQHDAPLDPNFTGAGHALTNAKGEYRFVTVKPGAYPWPNHYNAWRPPHIHFSVFGPAFATRLITQMYFPGDPLLALDPIFNSTPDEAARNRLVSSYAHDVSVEAWALGYRFDIVLRGPQATPMEG